MLIGILVTLVLFFGVRFLVSRCNAQPAIANAGGALAVLLFLLGVWAGAALFGGPAPVAVVPAPVTVSVATPAAPLPASTRTPVAEAPLTRVSPVSGSTTLASIDSITGDPNLGNGPPGDVFSPGATIFVNGWAASASKTPLKRLIFVIDHRITYDGTAEYGGQRADVAKAYNAPSMMSTGFQAVELSTNGLAKGRHVLQIGGVSDGSQHYHLASTRATFTLQ